MSADAGRPKAGHFPAQIEPPRPNRIIADSWRGLYGSAPFSSMWPGCPIEVLRNGAIGTNNSIFAVFYERVSGYTKPPAADLKQGWHAPLRREWRMSSSLI